MHKDSRGYYYKTKRINGKAVSEYLGKSELCDHLYRLEQSTEAVKRLDRKMEPDQAELEENECQELDRKIREADKLIHELVTGFLTDNGYHTHKGEWRKWRKRNKRRSNP